MREFCRIFWRAIVGHPIRFVGACFLAFSVLWTLTKAAFHFSDWAALKSEVWLALIVLLSLLYAMASRWRIAATTLHIRQSNVSVEVLFGDIFECDGLTAIPVGEYFDSEFGLPVSPNSLHGIFLTKCFGGHPQAFDEQIAQQLAVVRSTTIKKAHGKTRKYPIGTTALVGSAGKHYLAFALTRADPKTCKASANVPQMFEALLGLWKFARAHANGATLNLPLVGSGQSGIGLPATDLLYILLLSFLDESRREIITPKLRIVLTWDRFDEVDLRQLKTAWEGK